MKKDDNNFDFRIPYLSNAYKRWMVEDNEKTENVANSYISYIKSLNRKIFIHEEENFFELLKCYLDSENYDAVTTLFDKYLDIIDKWLGDTKKCYNADINQKKLSDWRSGFRNYRKFIEECLIYSSQKFNTINDIDNERIFAEDLFLVWLEFEDNKTRGTARSYVSLLRRLNRVASEKSSAQPKGKTIFHLIQYFLVVGKGETALDLMMNLIQMLNILIEYNDTSWMPISAMRNTISAVNKYMDFLIEELIDDIDITDEEDKEFLKSDNAIAEHIDNTSYEDEKELFELHDNIEKGKVYTYGYDELENNFRFRLNTQNRMSNGKDVFYPISIIKRLFRLSDNLLIEAIGSNRNHYRWFNKWVDNIVADIVIATDKGNTTLGNLSKFDAIIINSETKEVYVTFLSGERARMLTCIDGDISKTRYMCVDNLKDIHIDHNPLISSILSENKSHLSAMVRLTEIIKDIAKSNDLSIEPKNFSNIAKKVLRNKDVLVEMIALIPKIKKELLLINEKSTLQLMEAGYNIRKK